MRILLDVMGGDHPPEELVRGGVEAGKRHKIEVLFSGDAEVIRRTLQTLEIKDDSQFGVLSTTQIIQMSDAPVRAVRDRPDSSLVRGLQELKAGHVDALVSPANTGAVVAGSLFILGRIRGIPRPGILATLPTLSGQDILVIDVGATADCHPEHLVHFARMGCTYAQEIHRIENPSVGLLNIGTEKGKGNRMTNHAYDLLDTSDVAFAGNVEAHRLLSHRPVDVVVCSGFAGNVFLKATEGGVSGVTGLLRQSISSSLPAKLGAVLMKGAFKRLRAALSYEKRGGAPLLGVNGIVVIAHGRSNAEAIGSAIEVAYREVKADLEQRISKGIVREE